MELASLVGIQLKKVVRPAAGGVQVAPEVTLAAKLWAGRAAVVVVLRRPGWLFCREEVHKIFARKAEFDSLGVHLACIVKEALPDQIEQFQPTYWGSDELFVDEEMSFYKALGGGQVAKKGLLALGSKAVRDNNRRSKAYIAEHGLDSNLSGEGMILGGLIVLRPDDGGIVMQKNESTFGESHRAPATAGPLWSLSLQLHIWHLVGDLGDIAATDEVVAAARAAAYTGDQVPSEAVPPVDTVPTEEPTQEPAPEQEPA
jgi:hypothetical protein